MSDVNYEEIRKMTKEQEKRLRFDHFSNRDGWEDLSLRKYMRKTGSLRSRSAD